MFAGFEEEKGQRGGTRYLDLVFLLSLHIRGPNRKVKNNPYIACGDRNRPKHTGLPGGSNDNFYPENLPFWA